jgi:hypothetical protein
VKDSTGVCTCSIYANRPTICRAFPVINAKNPKGRDYQLSIYTMNTATLKGCPAWNTISPKDAHEITELMKTREKAVNAEYDKATPQYGPLVMAKMGMDFQKEAKPLFDLQNVPIILLKNYLTICKKGKNEVLNAIEGKK